MNIGPARAAAHPARSAVGVGATTRGPRHQPDRVSLARGSRRLQRIEGVV